MPKTQWQRCAKWCECGCAIHKSGVSVLYKFYNLCFGANLHVVKGKQEPNDNTFMLGLLKNWKVDPKKHSNLRKSCLMAFLTILRFT
jgi:hypothetical protein